ncbi:MAG TPA: Gfo/Idh/MocA family oxidoreductase [Balneolales bacterium]|nr:Gfo/Idh/MocA family oxidoreductase [Balneolales bacterium]
MKKIRWGIMGTGKIARVFADDLTYTEGAILQAVGSRSVDKANSFGNSYQIPNRHGSYEELASDPEVDVIYIATPHTYHATNSLLCLRSGKAVLCEKPFAINEQEASVVFQEANKRGLFIMEAMWSRYFPQYAKVRELIDEKVIGDLQLIQADFGFFSDYNPEGRLYNPDLGGGALLDIGIYPIDFTQYIMRCYPASIQSDAVMSSDGIDLQSSYILRYDNGILATLSSSIRTRLPNAALLSGTKGSIRIHTPFWHSNKITIHTEDDKRTIDMPYKGRGYHFEADEVMHCLRKGQRESQVMTPKETLKTIRIMDTIRKSWNLRYPAER